jgi:hypothetical protein
MANEASSPPYGTDRIGELRDTERTIAVWRQKAAEHGGHPPLSAFGFSSLDGADCAYRFVVCADPAGGGPTFVIYGSQLARLLELPEAPIFGAPMADQLPPRYASLFIEGCEEAIAQAQPVRMSGFVTHLGQVELYRAAFMPLAVWPKSPVRFVLGSFNRRIGPRASEADADRKTYRLLYEISEGLPPPV